MKKLMILTVGFFVMVYGAALADKANYRVFAPDGADGYEFIKSGEKQYKYFVLETGKSIEFRIKGPKKAKIRVRPDLGGGLKSSEFEILVWEGDKLVEGRKAESGKSKLSPAKGGGALGVARDIFFNAPKGEHTYRVTISSSSAKKFYLRFYQEKKKKKPKYINFKPSDFGKTANLKSKDASITYYLVDTVGDVKLSVVGPAEVKIYCRVNFDKTMKEKSKFALGIFEDGNSVKNFSGIAKKSGKTAWESIGELIPSTLHKYTLRVPSGKHNYTVKKVNSAAPSLSVRFKMKEDSFKKKK